MNMGVDKNVENCRIKLRYPDGIELEIEGPKEFVIEQKKELIYEIRPEINKKLTEKPKKLEDSLGKIMDFKQNIPYIKLRLTDLDTKMAILIILTAFKKTQNINSVTAITLSKALRLSGYQPKRIDREIAPLIKDKTIIARGTKRTREYAITEKGLTKSAVKIFNIDQNISKNE